MTVKINPFLYSILVDLEMNDFTVTDARDALLRESNDFFDDREARKVVHRILPLAIKNGFLHRSEEKAKGEKLILYSKTKLFFETKFTSKKKPLNIKKETSERSALSIYELEKELFECEIDLHTSISEATEYKSLQKRLPELANSLQNKYLAVKEKSSLLLGKSNALKNTIELIKTGIHQC